MENIGTVDFQKNLDFRSYFVLLVSKKIFAFLVTLSAAFLLRDYWALVIGIASSTAFGVLLSYIFSPYRPRLGLGKAREMFHFSKWLMANEVLSYLSLQADAGIVGKFVSTHVLGYYEIAKEVAALPNTELVWPIAKALFPGYAMVKDDVPRMRAMFLRSLSLAFALAQPMTVGIALGKPSVTTYVQTALNIPKLAFVTIGVLHNGAIGAAYGVLAAAVINYLSGYYLVWRFIGVSWREAFAVKWRVAVALAAMALAVEAASLLAGAQGDLTLLVVKTLVGALTYAGCLLSLWVACGRPAGGEQIILREIAARLPWLRKPAT